MRLATAATATNHVIDRDNRRRSPQRGRLLGDDRVEDAHDRLTRERRCPAEHLEEHVGDGEQIGAGIDPLAEHLFGRHVVRRTDDDAGQSQTGFGRRARLSARPRQTEVEQLHSSRGQQRIRSKPSQKLLPGLATRR